MTGGGDLDEIEDAGVEDADVDENEAVPSGADDTSVTFDEYDPDPTAGGSDIGGRAGDDRDEPSGAAGTDTGTGQGLSDS